MFPRGFVVPVLLSMALLGNAQADTLALAPWLDREFRYWQGDPPMHDPSGTEIPGTIFLGNVSGDPLLAAVAIDDLHLLAGSPAIGAGSTVADPLLDHDGNTYTAPRSIGALEYAGSTELRENRTSPVRLYPLPASEQIFIDVSTEGPGAIDLYDVNGRSVAHAACVSRITTLDIHGLQPGPYLVVVRSRSGLFRQMLLKE